MYENLYLQVNQYVLGEITAYSVVSISSSSMAYLSLNIF